MFVRSATAGGLNQGEGMDISAVDVIARDYQKKFKKALPHPKMDALVDQLSACLASGQKALVFVRRVASVDELQRKLEERYDEVLFARLPALFDRFFYVGVSRAATYLGVGCKRFLPAGLEGVRRHFDVNGWQSA
jgi:hypothetical protein